MIKILHIPSGMFLKFDTYEYGDIRQELDFSKAPDLVFITPEELISNLIISPTKYPEDFGYFFSQGIPNDTALEEFEVIYD